MSMKQTLNEKVVPAVMKFVNFKAIQALKDGILYTLPLNIIGSLFLLIANFPIPAFTNFCASVFGPDWQQPFGHLQHATMGMMGVVSVIGIAYMYAKNEGHEPLAAGMLALGVFFTLTNEFVMFAPDPKDLTTQFKVGGVFSQDWMGGQAMVLSLIVGLIVGALYSLLLSKDIKIKMPEGVPTGVANQFSALIPSAIILTGTFFILVLCKFFFNMSFGEIIYKVIQTPLQGLSDTPVGVAVIAFCIPFLWWFGVHGANVVSGIVTGILQANTADNAKLLTQGHLTIANGAHIFTQQFLDNFINMAGSGETLGLVLCMVFFAKSAQFKELSKLALVPNLFNINEPILFGIPIVMNPIMAIPFMITPVVTALLLYAAIASGLLAPMSGFLAPWTTPPIIAGFLIGGIPYALAQLIFLCLGALIYLPFFKKADAMAYADEVALKQQSDGGVQA